MYFSHIIDLADDSELVIASIREAMASNNLDASDVRFVETGRFFLSDAIGVLTVGLLRGVWRTYSRFFDRPARHRQERSQLGSP